MAQKKLFEKVFQKSAPLNATSSDKTDNIRADTQGRSKRLTIATTFLLTTGLVGWYSDSINLAPQIKFVIAVCFILGAILCAWLVLFGEKQNKISKSDANEDERPEDKKSKNLFLLRPNTTDKLTGLGGAKRFKGKFNKLAEGGDGTHFSIGVLNIDGMKPINRLYGMSGGDELLKQCASRLHSALESKGIIYRYNDDQFGIILPDIDGEKKILEVGKMLLDVLQAPFDIDNTPVRISASLGFAIYPDAGNNYDEVIGNVETALYQSKRQGRGRCTVYTSEIEKLVRENAALEQALRSAIASDLIQPHFQPIISLNDGSLLGFESLARWVDPKLGFVSPAKFITLAEERGIIDQLTEVLLLKSARNAAEWPDNLFLSFNLSSSQLADPSTAKSILRIIKKANLPPNRLDIEVTETAIISDPSTAEKVIEELHDAGVRISMDDFGTGQSSLGRLRELKLDKVKIDRAFIMAIGEDKPAEHIVRAILEMCAGLELSVVAEGIEEIGQAETLKKYGCHAAQGYLFGKPADANKTMSYIREFKRLSQIEDKAKLA